jgi:hypothetical protein
MAITITRVGQGHNHLRYLLTTLAEAGDNGTITTTGAVSPDLLTDSLFGPLKEMAKAFTDGYGTLPAGVLTQAQARSIWLGDNTVSIGNANIQRSHVKVSPRTGATQWVVDANVDGGGHPTLLITSDGGGGSCYLDVEVPGAIGA